MIPPNRRIHPTYVDSYRKVAKEHGFSDGIINLVLRNTRDKMSPNIRPIRFFTTFKNYLEIETKKQILVMKQTDINQKEFLLDVFERFGKNDAQAAIDFVRHNMAELIVKSQNESQEPVTRHGIIDMTPQELKEFMGKDLDATLALFKEFNNLFMGVGGCKIEDDERDNLDNYSSGIMAMLFVKFKAVGDYHVSRYQKNPFEAVDLGLPSGKRWANMNIGADNPEESGLYLDFKDANALEFEDGWSVPSKDDFIELCDNCESEWTTQNGVKGRIFKSKINGNAIFFPAAGHFNGTTLYDRGEDCGCWSSTLYAEARGYDLYFDASGVNPQNYNGRFYGFTVRAVQNLPTK